MQKLRQHVAEIITIAQRIRYIMAAVVHAIWLTRDIIHMAEQKQQEQNNFLVVIVGITVLPVFNIVSAVGITQLKQVPAAVATVLDKVNVLVQHTAAVVFNIIVQVVIQTVMQDRQQ
jgi:hypothetical protein